MKDESTSNTVDLLFSSHSNSKKASTSQWLCSL